MPGPTSSAAAPFSAIRAGLKVGLLGLALIVVLIPGNRVSAWAYPLLFGLPLVYAASRRDAERAFVLWTTYAISFGGFVVLRRVADDTGMPWLHRYVIEIDRILGIGSIPTVALQHLWYSPGTPGLLDAITVALHLSYYLVPPAIGIALWSRSQPVFERYLLAIAATYVAGLVLHFLVPTVPPWMAGELGYIDDTARVLYDRVSGASPRFYRFGNMLAGGNDVAAMPSLHMATAWLVALALRRIAPSLGVLGLLYAVGMGFALVYLGEHYAADLLGGILTASLCWQAAPHALARLLPLRSSRPAAPDPASDVDGR